MPRNHASTAAGEGSAELAHPPAGAPAAVSPAGSPRPPPPDGALGPRPAVAEQPNASTASADMATARQTERTIEPRRPEMRRCTLLPPLAPARTGTGPGRVSAAAPPDVADRMAPRRTQDGGLTPAR